ncbi:MAG: nitrile hydratase subunit beta [Rhodobacteraceae bacterium]|nr:nitrile hydratase subunit beta [Paracoccaceae bacterium]
MDGIHDLGGKEGFGPIPIDPTDEPFPNEWEGRMWGLAREQAVPGMTIDYFRHGLERMVPKDYLSFPYFGKWCANYYMLYLQTGVFTEEEILTGKTTRDPNAAPVAKTKDDIIAQNRASAVDFSLPIDDAPLHKVGDNVTTRAHMAARHTRLPAYARNATGRIIAHHGAHVMPDRNVEGHHVGEHLYTVEFAARDLFGESAAAKDTVTLDLWESYFV